MFCDVVDKIENLPFFLQENLNKHPSKDQLIEIILDLGRRPEARFISGPEYLSQKIVSWQDIDYITKVIIENRKKYLEAKERIDNNNNVEYNLRVQVNELKEDISIKK